LIQARRLLEVLDAFREGIHGSPVPEVAAFQIELVGFCVLGVSVDETLLLVATEPQVQLLQHLVRNLVLQGEQIRETPVILFAPQVTVVARVHQRETDLDALTAVHPSSGEDRLYAQVATDRLRVRLAALVADNRVARHHPQVRHLREAVDQPLRDGLRARRVRAV